MEGLMKVLGILAQKGGVGKSAVARSLAVAALADGLPTAILDADPQGTVVRWGQRRDDTAPTVIGLEHGALSDQLSKLARRGARLVLIDTPPHAQATIALAAEACDAVLLVTGPFPEDLEAIGATVAIVRALGRPAGIVLNKCPPRAAATALARAALTIFELPIWSGQITQLMSHPYAAAEGLTASEREPDSKAAIEIAGVWSWVKGTILVS